MFLVRLLVLINARSKGVHAERLSCDGNAMAIALQSSRGKKRGVCAPHRKRVALA
jgi:hypothetical protein